MNYLCIPVEIIMWWSKIFTDILYFIGFMIIIFLVANFTIRIFSLLIEYVQSLKK